MDYYDIISTSDAKKYLRIDAAFTEDDNDIKRMIRGALGYCEVFTGHLVYERSMTYHRGNEPRLLVYDHPIKAADISSNGGKVFSGYTDFGGVESVTLDVGYDDEDDVPAAIIEAALQIIEHWYYGKEGGEVASRIPDKANDILWQYKRYFVV